MKNKAEEIWTKLMSQELAVKDKVEFDKQENITLVTLITGRCDTLYTAINSEVCPMSEDDKEKYKERLNEYLKILRKMVNK